LPKLETIPKKRIMEKEKKKTTHRGGIPYSEWRGGPWGAVGEEMTLSSDFLTQSVGVKDRSDWGEVVTAITRE